MQDQKSILDQLTRIFYYNKNTNFEIITLVVNHYLLYCVLAIYTSVGQNLWEQLYIVHVNNFHFECCIKNAFFHRILQNTYMYIENIMFTFCNKMCLLKVSATLQGRPRADHFSTFVFNTNPYKPYIF